MSRSATRGRGEASDAQKARSRPRGARKALPRINPLQETVLIVGSILGIVCGLVFAGVSFGAWYASREAVDILREIGARDTSGPREQVDGYEKFFKGLDQKQFIVRRDEPRNLQNVITYLWTVEHRASGEVTQFRWEWDMSTLNVLPRSNGALLLDLRLKNLVQSDVENYEFYDPGDEFAQAIVNQDVSLIEGDSAEEAEPSWSDEVIPPLVSPDDALSRKGAYEDEKKKEFEDEQGGEAGGGAEENSDEDKSAPEVRLPDSKPPSPPVRDDM